VFVNVRGENPADAETHYVENAKNIALYGVHMYPAKVGHRLETLLVTLFTLTSAIIHLHLYCQTFSVQSTSLLDYTVSTIAQ